MNDRIKLAEAMGYYLQAFPVTHTDGSEGMSDFKVWHAPNHRRLEPTEELPDPFTDANDDYAVLEWITDRPPLWAKFKRLYWPHAWAYQIGDYARAALTVLQQHGEK